MHSKILIYLTHPEVDAWNFKNRHLEYLKNNFPDSEFTNCLNSKEFLDRLPGADTVIVWFFKKKWLNLSKRLKLIATPAAGKDWIEVEAKDSSQVSFGSFHGSMIAESVVGAMLYFCKAFEVSKKMQHQQKWARVKISQKISSLMAAKVTILGFGNIGVEIGKQLKPFRCSIAGVRRNLIKEPDYFDNLDKIVTPDQMKTVLQNTDHLIFALPGGQETNGVFSKDHFQHLPKRSFVYNIGRGNVYQETDLIAALRSKNIAGAYLDVFEQEPLSYNSPLWDMENVLIQPHLSAASPKYLDLYVRELAIEWKKQESQ